jgi:hypothetical protein
MIEDNLGHQVMRRTGADLLPRLTVWRDTKNCSGPECSSTSTSSTSGVDLESGGGLSIETSPRHSNVHVSRLVRDHHCRIERLWCSRYTRTSTIVVRLTPQREREEEGKRIRTMTFSLPQFGMGGSPIELRLPIFSNTKR